MKLRQFGEQLKLSGKDLICAINNAKTIQDMNKLRIACVTNISKEILEMWQKKYWMLKKKYSYHEAKALFSKD